MCLCFELSISRLCVSQAWRAATCPHRGDLSKATWTKFAYLLLNEDDPVIGYPEQLQELKNILGVTRRAGFGGMHCDLPHGGRWRKRGRENSRHNLLL